MGQGQAKDAGGGSGATSGATFCVPEPTGAPTLSEEQLCSLLDEVRAGVLKRSELEHREKRTLPLSLGSTQRYRQCGFVDEEQVAHKRAALQGEKRDIRALQELVDHLEKSELELMSCKLSLTRGITSPTAPGPTTAYHCSMWITTLSSEADEGVQDALNAKGSSSSSSSSSSLVGVDDDLTASVPRVELLSLRTLMQCLEIKDVMMQRLALRLLTLLFRAARDKDARCSFNSYAIISAKINEATGGSTDSHGDDSKGGDDESEGTRPKNFLPEKLEVFKPDPTKGEKNVKLFALHDRMSTYFGFRGIAAISTLLTDDLHVKPIDQSEDDDFLLQIYCAELLSVLSVNKVSQNAEQKGEKRS